MSQNPVIGEKQLMAWEIYALRWHTYVVKGHTRCQRCDVSIWRIHDDSGQGYVYSDAEILALKVAHIRQCHGDLEEIVYQEAGISWLI